MTNLTDYMSFDVSWFTTLPGILITVGLILLIVGLICFLLSGKKKKGDVAPVGDATATTQPDAQVPQTEAPAVTENAPVAAQEVAQQPEVVVPSVEQQAPTPAVEAPTPVETATPTQPVEQPTEPTPVTPEAPAQVEVASQPETEAATEKVELTPVPNEASINGEHVAEEKKEEVKPVVETMEVKPSTDSAVSIYGGANPQVTIEQDNKPKAVYGGADPLENTGAIPRVEVPTEPVLTPEVPKVEEKPAEVTAPTPEVVVPATEAPAPVAEEKKVDDVETLEF